MSERLSLEDRMVLLAIREACESITALVDVALQGCSDDNLARRGNAASGLCRAQGHALGMNFAEFLESQRVHYSTQSPPSGQIESQVEASPQPTSSLALPAPHTEKDQSM